MNGTTEGDRNERRSGESYALDGSTRTVVVYFNANSHGCSGWLNVGARDVVCFSHFMEDATEFSTPDEAVAAANDRIMRIRRVIEDCAKKPPYMFGLKNNIPVEEQMKQYKYFILRKEVK